MTWNHKDRLFGMAVSLQTQAGAAGFNQPTINDLIGVANPSNGNELQSVADPTQTGTVFEQQRIYLGKSGVIGGTIPLRGPGGAAVPLAGAWPVGRILQAAGFAEVRQAATRSALIQGSGANTLTLANTESASDDFLIGVPIRQTAIGSGAKATTLISDYVGATKVATIPEFISAPPAAGAGYDILANLTYLLGTLTTAPPLLAVSVYRDRRRYDYFDCTVTNLTIDIPVSNEAAQGFPSIQFQLRGTPLDPDNTIFSTPPLPDAIRNVPVPPARNGKFFLDSNLMGHASVRFTLGLTNGAQSDQNAFSGQDAYDILGATRQIALDLNQSDITTFDLEARINSQAMIPLFSQWGSGPGNTMGFLTDRLVLDPHTVGTRNGYVSTTGNASPVSIDKSTALTFWGWPG